MQLKNSTWQVVAAAALLCVQTLCFGPCAGCRRASKKNRPTHDQVAGPPALRVAATALRMTVVTPHLEHPIRKGQNVLWSATAQLAWNELSRLMGESVRLTNKPTLAHHLNKSTLSQSELDKESYVALAGFVRDGILGRIRRELRARFGVTADPSLLSPAHALAPSDWVAYAYLFKHLPFRSAFKRFKHPFSFGGRNVESFGIRQYLDTQQDEVLAASQVQVYDFRSDSDFIVELKTRSENDRLLLARVRPRATLAKTIQAVQKRVASSKPTPLQKMADLTIPVFNFDITRDYVELGRGTIQARNPRFHGSRIAIARQRIRFRLDEMGATLKCESTYFFCKTRDLVFRGPFLVLLNIRGAAHPYFALWIDNAEVLVPFRK